MEVNLGPMWDNFIHNNALYRILSRRSGTICNKIGYCDMYSWNASHKGEAERKLYDLLDERSEYENVNISHTKMPTWQEHIEFFDSNPYKVWYVLLKDNKFIGHFYISHQNEVGIFLLREYQMHGYGPMVLKAMIERYSDLELYANINPKNNGSIDMFRGLGFKHIQNTYKLSR